MKTKEGIIYSFRDVIAMRLLYFAFKISPKNTKRFYAEAIFSIAASMADESNNELG